MTAVIPAAVSSSADAPTSTPPSQPPPINLLRGWPNLRLLPTTAIADAAATALNDPDVVVPGLCYAPDEGYTPLREEIANWLSRFYHGHQVDGGAAATTAGTTQAVGVDRITITGGASQNLACLLQVYTDPVYTRNVWLVSPTYFLACRIFEDSGFKGRLRSVPEDDEGIDVEFLRQALARSEEDAAQQGNDEPKLKSPRPWSKIYRHVIYAVPTFSNPSGGTMSLRRRQELVRLAREYDALIVTDDVYDQLQWPVVPPAEVLEPRAEIEAQANGGVTASATTTTEPPFKAGKPVTASRTVKLATAVLPRLVDVDRVLDGGAERAGADGFGNAVSNGSFSKIVGPGCRTGWAEGTAKLAYGLSQVGSSRSGGAPSQLTATIITALMRSGAFERHINDTLVPAYAARHRLITAAVQRHLVPLGVRLPAPAPAHTDDHHHPSPPVASEPSPTAAATAAIVGGYFLWLELPPPLDASAVSARARTRHGVVVAHGSLFDVYGDERGPALARGVRLCFAFEEPGRLEEGVARLGRTVREMLEEARDPGMGGEDGGAGAGAGAGMAHQQDLAAWR